MELSFNVIVILIICLIVAVVGIIFGMGILTEGKEGTEYFWGVEQCIPRGERCSVVAGSDRCCEDYVCIRESPYERYTFCFEPGVSGDYCERDVECVSNDCGYADEDADFRTCQ